MDKTTQSAVRHKMLIYYLGNAGTKVREEQSCQNWNTTARTLKTKRIADFTCHWYRPCLDYEKGKMFEQGKDNLS